VERIVEQACRLSCRDSSSLQIFSDSVAVHHYVSSLDSEVKPLDSGSGCGVGEINVISFDHFSYSLQIPIYRGDSAASYPIHECYSLSSHEYVEREAQRR
jgi:hypothetical protein